MIICRLCSLLAEMLKQKGKQKYMIQKIQFYPYNKSFICRRISLTFLLHYSFFICFVRFGYLHSYRFHIFIIIGEINAFCLQGMDDTQVRSAATDIFSYLVEYNPSMVREFVMQEAQQNDDVSKKLTEQKITSKVNIICTNSKYLYIGSYNFLLFTFKI